MRELAHLKTLQSLDLGGCARVTDVGLKELAALKHLRWLSLSKCDKVSDNGASELMKSIPQLKVGR